MYNRQKEEIKRQYNKVCIAITELNFCRHELMTAIAAPKEVIIIEYDLTSNDETLEVLEWLRERYRKARNQLEEEKKLYNLLLEEYIK